MSFACRDYHSSANGPGWNPGYPCIGVGSSNLPLGVGGYTPLFENRCLQQHMRRCPSLAKGAGMRSQWCRPNAGSNPVRRTSPPPRCKQAGTVGETNTVTPSGVIPSVRNRRYARVWPKGLRLGRSGLVLPRFESEYLHSGQSVPRKHTRGDKRSQAKRGALKMPSCRGSRVQILLAACAVVSERPKEAVLRTAVRRHARVRIPPTASYKLGTLIAICF